MSYLTTFYKAFLFFPVVALFITIPFILIQYHKYGSINKLRVLIIYSFILYMITIFFLIILPLPSFEDVVNLTTPKVQLIPFRFIVDFVKETPLILSKPSTYLKALCDSSFYTIIFNLFMFIPFGMYLRYYFKKDLKGIIKYSFLLSLFFELTQLSGLYFIYPRPYRLFDIDDLMINTLGGVIGHYIMGLIKFLPSREDIDRKTFEDSKQVSGLRRITMFCLDLVIFITIELFIYIFISNKVYIKYIIFLVYYVIVPYFWNGKTLGSNFLNIRLSFANKKLLRLLVNIVMQFLYYLVIPFISVYCSFYLISKYDLNIKLEIILMLVVLLVFGLYYLINLVILLKNKRMFYDKISKVEFISTIDKKKDLED